MATITFKDKTTLQAEDYSTVTEIVVKTTADKVGGIIKQVTEDNLSAVVIGNRTVEKVIPTGNNSFSVDRDNVVLTFRNRYQTEVEKIKGQMEELMIALDEIAGSEVK